TSTDGLGSANGGLDLAKVRALFSAVAAAIGVSDTNGINLPGGIILAATRTDPLTISLAGTIALPVANDQIELQIGLDITRTYTVAPRGRVKVRIAMPGSSWSAIEIEVGADPAG